MQALFHQLNQLKINKNNSVIAPLARRLLTLCGGVLQRGRSTCRQGKEWELLALSPGWNREQIKRIGHGRRHERTLNSIHCF